MISPWVWICMSMSEAAAAMFCWWRVGKDQDEVLREKDFALHPDTQARRVVEPPVAARVDQGESAQGALTHDEDVAFGEREPGKLLRGVRWHPAQVPGVHPLVAGEIRRGDHGNAIRSVVELLEQGARRTGCDVGEVAEACVPPHEPATSVRGMTFDTT